MKLKCQCCGIEAEFKDGEEAFQKGWDAPPHFTTHVCCDLCPAVCVVLGKGHSKAHAHWKEHGRPKEFGPSCFVDEHLAAASSPQTDRGNLLMRFGEEGAMEPPKDLAGTDLRFEFGPQVQRAMADDPEMAVAMQEMMRQMRQAQDWVKEGRYATFSDALEAISGERPQAYDPDTDDSPEAEKIRDSIEEWKNHKGNN